MALNDRFAQMRGDKFAQMANVAPGAGSAGARPTIDNVRGGNAQKLVYDMLNARGIAATPENIQAGLDYMLGGTARFDTGGGGTAATIADAAMVGENVAPGGGGGGTPAPSAPASSPNPPSRPHMVGDNDAQYGSGVDNMIGTEATDGSTAAAVPAGTPGGTPGGGTPDNAATGASPGIPEVSSLAALAAATGVSVEMLRRWHNAASNGDARAAEQLNIIQRAANGESNGPDTVAPKADASQAGGPDMNNNGAPDGAETPRVAADPANAPIATDEIVPNQGTTTAGDAGNAGASVVDELPTPGQGAGGVQLPETIQDPRNAVAEQFGVDPANVHSELPQGQVLGTTNNDGVQVTLIREPGMGPGTTSHFAHTPGGGYIKIHGPGVTQRMNVTPNATNPDLLPPNVTAPTGARQPNVNVGGVLAAIRAAM